MVHPRAAATVTARGCPSLPRRGPAAAAVPPLLQQPQPSRPPPKPICMSLQDACAAAKHALQGGPQHSAPSSVPLAPSGTQTARPNTPNTPTQGAMPLRRGSAGSNAGSHASAAVSADAAASLSGRQAASAAGDAVVETTAQLLRRADGSTQPLPGDIAMRGTVRTRSRVQTNMEPHYLPPVPMSAAQMVSQRLNRPSGRCCGPWITLAQSMPLPLQVRRPGARPQQWRCMVPVSGSSGTGSHPDVALRLPDQQPAKRPKREAASARPPAARQWEWESLGGPAVAALCRAAFPDFVA